MPNLNSKFVKQLEKSDNSNLCTLYVKGDWNDADYITEDTHWELAELNKMLPYLSILVDLFALIRTIDIELMIIALILEMI